MLRRDVPVGRPDSRRCTLWRRDELHSTPCSQPIRPGSECDPYCVEIAETAFKLGDGGEAVCGSYPWPIVWLSFCPSYRLVGGATEDLLSEFLEEAQVRPVRI